jgi:hypothetical protein
VTEAIGQDGYDPVEAGGFLHQEAVAANVLSDAVVLERLDFHKQ